MFYYKQIIQKWYMVHTNNKRNKYCNRLE